MRALATAFLLFLATPVLADSNLPPSYWAYRQLPDAKQEAKAQALMQEIRYDDIRVTTIAPGSVDTEFSGNHGRGADWKIAPSDVAAVVMELLASDPRSLASRVEMRPSKPRK